MAVTLTHLLLIVCEIYSVFGAESQCVNNKCPLRKCCVDGEALNVSEDLSATCVQNTVVTLGAVHNIQPFNIIHGKNNCDENESKILLDKSKNDFFDFDLQDNGTLVWAQKAYSYDKFCVDTFQDRLVATVCAEGDDEAGDTFNSIGMIISMPFLLATFLVYALLPDRNLHMKALMSYVINLMLSYLLLVIIQLSKTRFPDTQCQLIGYFCLFFFIVSFFWMNVICIDIWFTFSGLRGFSGSRGAERKRFLLYCAYAWGMSILHILVVFTVDRLSRTGLFYKPDIGSGQCFLKRGYPELLYFYGPMAVLISINITLFAITAIKIRAIKKDTSMLKKEDSKRHSYENDKQTFNLYLKLLFAMGVNWSMEIISWAVNWSLGEGNAPPAIWYLTDFCNAIYGVFIFFIFVFKRSIWKLLKKRYYSFIGKPHLAHSMTQNPTRVTSYSTTQTSVSDHHGGVNDNTVLTSEA